ncbi:glycoside hydrolase family 3 protein [bacterium]|nr:glycoside hydrolase family 3 protein [bacterium]
MNVLKKQIGQLMVIGFQGTKPSDDFLEFVSEWGIGGIIFFARNIADPKELPKTISLLENASGGHIFSAIDQEGGAVLRILQNGSLFPGAMALSATGDPSISGKVYRAIGMEMRSLGLNWNLAPVLDINDPSNPGIGIRSFGDSPRVVAEFGLEAIKGLKESGVFACAKHFPGKGSAKVDSHLTLPIIPYDKDRLFSVELVPFIEAIHAGVEAIMPAHVFFPAFETKPNLPATLSSSVLTDLLRKTLGFKGMLITDDLEMGAITETFGVADAARSAFLAGADLLLICHDLEKQRLAAKTILEEVKSSSLGAFRLEESKHRIFEAREKNFSFKPPPVDLDSLVESNKELIEVSHSKAILIRRMSIGRLPLSTRNPKVFILPEIEALVQVEEEQKGEGLSSFVNQYWPEAQCVFFPPKCTTEEIWGLIAGNVPRPNAPIDLVILSYNAHLFTGQKDAFNKAAKEFPTLILAAIRNPYDVDAVFEAKNSLATFGFRSPSIHALFRVLSGVSLPGETKWPIEVGKGFNI